MRIAIAVPLGLAVIGSLAACQVSKDDANGTTSVTYNSDVAQNAAADIGNTAQNIAADIGNDVKNTSDKVQEKVGNSDVSVNVNKNEKTENKADENKSQ
jgi:hypothetical protein